MFFAQSNKLKLSWIQILQVFTLQNAEEQKYLNLFLFADFFRLHFRIDFSGSDRKLRYLKVSVLKNLGHFFWVLVDKNQNTLSS